MATRTRAARLDPEERRAQLIELGLRMLSSETPERVPVDEIAEAAGVSRGLLYHYFPTKRDFYVAVNRAAAAEVGELTASAPSLPLAEQLRAGIDAYLRYAEARPHGFLTAYRGALAGDAEVRATVE